jgi:NAD(P)-dependent dehydrogenase (short-subunit alcohol dehydrogenase family)
MALSLAQIGIAVLPTYDNKKAEADEVVRQIESGGQQARALQLDVSDSKSFAAFAHEVKIVLGG